MTNSEILAEIKKAQDLVNEASAILLNLEQTCNNCDISETSYALAEHLNKLTSAYIEDQATFKTLEDDLTY